MIAERVLSDTIKKLRYGKFWTELETNTEPPQQDSIELYYDLKKLKRQIEGWASRNLSTLESQNGGKKRQYKIDRAMNLCERFFEYEEGLERLFERREEGTKLVDWMAEKVFVVPRLNEMCVILNEMFNALQELEPAPEYDLIRKPDYGSGNGEETQGPLRRPLLESMYESLVDALKEAIKDAAMVKILDVTSYTQIAEEVVHLRVWGIGLFEKNSPISLDNLDDIFQSEPRVQIAERFARMIRITSLLIDLIRIRGKEQGSGKEFDERLSQDQNKLDLAVMRPVRECPGYNREVLTYFVPTSIKAAFEEGKVSEEIQKEFIKWLLPSLARQVKLLYRMHFLIGEHMEDANRRRLIRKREMEKLQSSEMIQSPGYHSPMTTVQPTQVTSQPTTPLEAQQPPRRSASTSDLRTHVPNTVGTESPSQTGQPAIKHDIIAGPRPILPPSRKSHVDSLTSYGNYGSAQRSQSNPSDIKAPIERSAAEIRRMQLRNN